MADSIKASPFPIPEKTLRDLSKTISSVLPDFSAKEAALGVNELHAVIFPLLDTADSPDLTQSHRAAVYNILCAALERCQASPAQYARDALLDDAIWTRLFNVYLTRSDKANSKSMRQVLLALTNVLLRNTSEQSTALQKRAVIAFLDIICERQDRVKVKPALQGLAHFIQKSLFTPTQLVEIHADLLNRSKATTSQTPEEKNAGIQSIFSAFLNWVVHHDTALSAGHVVRNFLAQYRSSLQATTGAIAEEKERSLPFWIEPVVETLRTWPDRVQEFKTHVFPYCSRPDLGEYLRFLSYLHFDRYVTSTGGLPIELRSIEEDEKTEEKAEEFRLLLAAIETGKELGIVKDVDYRTASSIEVHQKAIRIPDSIFGGWLSHTEPDVRLAGLYLSIVSSAATRPVTGGIFNSLKRNMIHLHADSDANFRRELLSYIQKLFDRLRGSTATLARQGVKPKLTGEERFPFPKEAFDLSGSTQSSQLQDSMIGSLRFIVWYLRVLEWDLRLEASYQRRVTAVRALIVVLKSGIDPRVPRHLLSKGAQGQLGWMHGISVPNPKLIRTLLDLVLDPFDDIREASVMALQLCLEASPEKDRKATLAKLPGFINRAEAVMLRTGRADQADGVARAYSLYFSCSTGVAVNDAGLQSGSTSKLSILTHLNQQLKETLEIAVENISQAVNGRPVHGTFAAIRYIFDQENFYSDVKSLSGDEYSIWRNIHDDIIGKIEFLWSCVWNILCADAPEGHIPEDLEEEVSLDTKEILSYSWRGLKEASVLLRVIITRCPIGAGEHTLLDVEKIEKFGDLCFNQLVELRHRGAFSTVAQTFAAFCRRCVTAEEPTLRALPEKWYTKTLSTIQAKADTITRRSGGLPALMTGIVAADSQPEGKFFQRAMRDLVAEASVDAQSSNIEESRLPQVHALNCIKDFFMSSRLSVASEAYLGEGLELAARTLNSKIWPIRNCSLMLFKALIERLLGSDEAQDWKERDGARTTRFSFASYPSLIEILRNLLDPEGPLKESLSTPNSNSPMDLHGAEGVFPALQILRQAAPPEENRTVILKSVMKLLGSPHWHMRDMAARTATILHQPQEYQTTIKTLLECQGIPTNLQHGQLLCAKYMLSRHLQNVAKLGQWSHKAHTKPVASDQEALAWTEVLTSLTSAAEGHMSHSCLPIRGAFLDLVSSCGLSMMSMPVIEVVGTAWARLSNAVSIASDFDLEIQHGENDALFRQSLAKVFFVDRAHLYLSKPTVLPKQDIGEALVHLSNQDVDTCLTALDTLNDIIQLNPPSASLWPPSQLLSCVFRLVLEATDAEVLSKAQTVLADALADTDSFTFEEGHVAGVLSKLENQCLSSAPSNMRSALRLLAYFLDQTYCLYPSQHSTLWPLLARYIRLLRMTIIDTNPFDDRFAAVQSVASLRHLWSMDRTANPTSSLTLGLAFVLYDLLNDDDEEIRELASISAMQLIHSQPHPKTSSSPTQQFPPAEETSQAPMLTTHHLSNFLARTFATHPALHREAVRRLTLSPPLSNSSPQLTPLSAPLSALLTPTDHQTALFATEKQNLYQDLSLDAALWSRILSSLPASNLAASLRRELTRWTAEALSTLISTARREKNGELALGWCSKANGDVCSLGLRAVQAAGVVVGFGVLDGEQDGGAEVRRLLGAFAGLDDGEGIHALWKEKAEAVLEAFVMRLLRGVSESADGLGYGL